MAVLQEMNPLVSVRAASGSASAPPDTALLSKFQVVLLVSPSLALISTWDEACASVGVAFFGGCSRGAVSFLFADLGECTYTQQVLWIYEVVRSFDF